jgi:membrane protein DedA with SNARE-associated domain
VTALILRVIGAGGYLGIAFLMALENIIPPIPSEFIMGFGGILVAHGQMTFSGLVLAGTIGSTAGNYAWYLVGRHVGLARLRPFIERHGRWLTLTWRDVERVDRFFQRHGGWLVFAVRFSPAFRTMISLPAGLVHMPRWRFLAWTAAGTTVWNIFLAAAGYYLGAHFQRAEAWMGPAAVVVTVVIVAWYLWRVATWKPAA